MVVGLRADVRTAEWKCREFAKLFPTPAVQRCIALAAAGKVTWNDTYRLFCEAMEAASAFADRIMQDQDSSCEGVGD